MNPTDAFLLAFGGNAILIAALGFLAKSLISQWLTREIKRFEADLQRTSAAAAEEMKHRLSLVAHEHHVRFSRLHEKQAEVLEEAYSKLLDFETASASLGLASNGTPEEFLESALRQAEDAGWELVHYIRRKEIYLPAETSAQLQKLIAQIISLLSSCSFNLLGMKLASSGRQDLFPDVKDAWGSIHRYLDHEAPAVRGEIIVEFRRLLGAYRSDA
jgi:hypothetical protein